MQDKLYNMLLSEDEITWKAIILDLVKTEQMDPWDINITLLTQRYIETIKNMEEHNFFISGKILLAASILLRLKSNKLLTEYLANFDNLLFPPENIEELEEFKQLQECNAPKLLIKTPQQRKRKVNLNDLMSALQKALEVDTRRRMRKLYEVPIRNFDLPNRSNINILDLIKNLYNKIIDLFKKKETITFTELIPSENRKDKIHTFIPLLHLENKGKVNLNQEIPFSEIFITKPVEEVETDAKK